MVKFEDKLMILHVKKLKYLNYVSHEKNYLELGSTCPHPNPPPPPTPQVKKVKWSVPKLLNSIVTRDDEILLQVLTFSPPIELAHDK